MKGNGPSYRVVYHAVSGCGDPRQEDCAALPQIEKMDILQNVSYIEVFSPEPLAFKLHRRADAPYDACLPYQTLYFPDAELIAFECLRQFADDDEKLQAYYAMAMRGFAYRYYLAGGAGEKDAKPEEANFILTRDNRLFAFDINCVLLQPAYRGATHAGNSNVKWDKVTLPRYELGGYKTS